MSNGRLTNLLAYESYEAPMMLHAMRIAANTALMCGNPGARARFQQMIDEIKPIVPYISKVFDEEVFGEMGAALQDCTEFTVRWMKVRWRREWEREGHIAVVIGDMIFASKDTNIRDDSPLLDELIAYVNEIAPITATFVPYEEVEA